MMLAGALLLSAATSDIVVARPEVDPAVEARRAKYAQAHPPLRGFRAGILDQAGDSWPIALPDPTAEPKLHAAAMLVAQRIASDGLVPTLVRVIDVLGPDLFEHDDQQGLLRSAGIPVDWLRHFDVSASPSVPRWISLLLHSGTSVDDVIARANQEVTFAFRPTVAGFRVATESGEHDAECVRFQVARPAWFQGEGDGGALDVARQLVTKLENVQLVAVIQDANLEKFLQAANAWNTAPGSTFRLVPQALPVTEWAQDNGKPGIVTRNTREVVTLVPRYASRGEEGASFLPGDTFALESFASTGWAVAQSPLFFQGGDLVPVLDPKTNKRQMLVGEAEIARNRTLGLTQAQVLEAFRAEFGVERCLVLPATSFHVDYEVTVRATPDGLVAFMNDSSAAARLVMQCGFPALERAGAFSAKGRKMAEEDVAAGRWDVVVQRVNDAITPHMVGPGAFPESFSKHFAGGPSDSGIGNLQRFVLALDVLVAENTGDRASAEKELDPHLTAYLFSIRRREIERQHVANVLAREGFRIVGVPSTSEGARSLTTINGVHVRGAYYMPAYGGLYADFDRAAQAVFEKNLGAGVRVVPILCGESMRREGALHCAVSILPRL